MRYRFIIVTSWLSVLVVGAGQEPASAVCFAIPRADSVYSATNEADVRAVRAQVPSELSFRGRLGRVDRAIVAPGLTETIRVAADPVCKSRPLAALQASASALKSDDVVAVVASRNAKGALLRAQVYAKNCTDLVANSHVDAKRFSCADSAAKISTTSKNQPMVELVLENIPNNRPALVSVVVVGAADVAKATSAIAEIGKSGETCSRLASTRQAFEERFDGAICVDTFYRDYGYAGACDSARETWAVAVSDVDPANCSMISVPTNDFGKNCTEGANDDGHLAKCQWKPDTIYVETLTHCGALVIPFNYASIKKNEDDPTQPVSRYLSGATPVSRTADPSSGPIYLPGGKYGAEFLGSMPLGGVSTNHRKTDIGTDTPEEKTLLRITGSVDEDGSAILVYPRMPVSVVCKDGDNDDSNNEACQCFYSDGNDTRAGCALGDACSALPDSAGDCVGLSTSEVRYYACEAKDANLPYHHTGLPCTRPEHCGADGKCTAMPVCVDSRSAVWESGWARPAGADDCVTDNHSVHGCPSGFQCGFSLFDFSGRSTIEYDFPKKASAARAGVCRNNQSRSCNRDDDCANAPCIGYTLRAGREK